MSRVYKADRGTEVNSPAPTSTMSHRTIDPSLSELYKGDRVHLRELVESDVTERYLSWFRSEDVVGFLEARALRREDVLEYIRYGKESETHYLYAICVNETDEHIGNVKVGPIDRKHMTSDLVTVIGEPTYWGKGLATEAIGIGNQVAFQQHEIRKLSGGIHSANIGSIRAYTKAGWIIEGILKGHYILDGTVMDRVCVSCFNPEYFHVSGNFVQPKSTT